MGVKSCEEVGFDVRWEGGRKAKMEVEEEGLLEGRAEGRTARSAGKATEVDL